MEYLQKIRSSTGVLQKQNRQTILTLETCVCVCVSVHMCACLISFCELKGDLE